MKALKSLLRASFPGLYQILHKRFYILKYRYKAYRAYSSTPFSLLENKPPKVLFFCCVGKDGIENIRKIFESFKAHPGIDFLFVVWDGSPLQLGSATVLHQKGAKWRHARNHLSAEKVDAYDFIFVWDDDIDVTHFSLSKFLEIMTKNRLDIAQPALSKDSYFSHEIVVVRNNSVGRLTDFVEVMVPVFTRSAWNKLREMIPTNYCDWGQPLDYYLMALTQCHRMGIIDATPVKHTRPISSTMRGEVLNDIKKFDDEHQHLQRSMQLNIAPLSD